MHRALSGTHAGTLHTWRWGLPSPASETRWGGGERFVCGGPAEVVRPVVNSLSVIIVRHKQQQQRRLLLPRRRPMLVLRVVLCAGAVTPATQTPRSQKPHFNEDHRCILSHQLGCRGEELAHLALHRFSARLSRMRDECRLVDLFETGSSARWEMHVGIRGQMVGKVS